MSSRFFLLSPEYFKFVRCNRSICATWVLNVLIFTLIIFHLCTLSRLPAPYIDEAWFIARARGFAEHGYPFGMLDTGVFDRLPSYQYFFPYFPTALQAIPFIFSDEVNLFATRLISLLCGFAIVFCVYRIGSWVSGALVGKLSAVLLLASSFFIFSSHVARIDIEAAAVGITGFTIILTSVRKNWWLLILGGFLSALSVEFHAHAAVITATALAAAISVGVTIRERALYFFLVSTGCGLAGLVYALLHIFPDPSAFLALQKIAFAPSHTPPLLTFDPLIILTGIYQSIFHSLVVQYQIAPWLCLVIFLSGIPLVNGRTRTIGVLAAVALISSGLLIRHKFFYYNIYYFPFTLIFIASLTIYLLKEVDIWCIQSQILGRIVQICCALICLCIIINFKDELSAAFNSPHAHKTLPQLAPFIRPDDTVLGRQTYWLAVPNNKYYSPEHLIYYTRWKSGSSVSDALRDLRPTVIIADDTLREFAKVREGKCSYICFPDDGLERLIASSELIGQTAGADGIIRIYRTRFEP